MVVYLRKDVVIVENGRVDYYTALRRQKCVSGFVIR